MDDYNHDEYYEESQSTQQAATALPAKKQPQSLQEIMQARKKPSQPPRPPPPVDRRLPPQEYDFHELSAMAGNSAAAAPALSSSSYHDTDGRDGGQFEDEEREPPLEGVGGFGQEEFDNSINYSVNYDRDSRHSVNSTGEEEMPSSADFVMFEDDASAIAAIFGDAAAEGAGSGPGPVSDPGSGFRSDEPGGVRVSPASSSSSTPAHSSAAALSPVVPTALAEEVERERQKLSREFEIKSLALSGENHQKTETIERLREELRAANEATMQMERKHSALAAKAGAVGGLEENIAGMAQQQGQLEQQLTVAKEDAAHWKAEAGNGRVELNKLKMELNKLKMELSRSQAEQGAQTAECEELRTATEALRTQLRDAEVTEQSRSKDASSRSQALVSFIGPICTMPSLQSIVVNICRLLV